MLVVSSTEVWGGNRFSRNPNTLKFQGYRPMSRLFSVYSRIFIHLDMGLLPIPGPRIGIHLDNWNRNTFFPTFDGIGIHLFWDKWNFESNYYQEYEYISFFALESESNHPLGEMVTSPKFKMQHIANHYLTW